MSFQIGSFQIGSSQIGGFQISVKHNNITHNIEEVFNKFFITNKIAVAVSGGSDSMALVFALRDFCQENNIEICALIIDHQIRQNSAQEAYEVAKLLKNFNIANHILKIPSQQIPRKNIEANLREIRYQLLTDFCKNNNYQHLFVGHHLGDIAENFLIRLFRGSGLDGLSSMQEIIEINNIKIIRPFLNLTKENLQDFLRARNIKWFEDETNQDEKFLRNKIRNFLASFEDKNIIENRIYNATQEIAKTRDLFDEIVASHEPKIIIADNDDYTLINRQKLAEINSALALKILAKILIKISGQKYKPRKEKLIRFYDYLIDEKELKKREFYGCVAERLSTKKDDYFKVKIYKKLKN